jgi:hypothetical protein
MYTPTHALIPSIVSLEANYEPLNILGTVDREFLNEDKG